MENKNSGVTLRKKVKNKANFRAICAAFFLISLLLAVIDFVFIPPASYKFGAGKIIKIKEGFNLNESADTLKKEEIIKSEFIFKIIVNLLNGDKKIKAGTYSFDKPYSAFDVAQKIIIGDFGIPFVKILIKEGQTIEKIGEIFEREGLFKKEDFFAYTGCCAGKILPNLKNYLIYSSYLFSAAESGQPRILEGFFFPDTYFLPKNIEPQEAVEIVLKNFTNKMNGEIMDEIKKSGKNFYDVLIIASILEKEAQTIEDKKIIADIIQKRITAKMPLQVDASLEYVLHKNTFELTKKDLLFDSPYNTYKYKELPKTPISNPGIDSISAALNPTPNDYWYYLSDKSSFIHYSKNYTEHKNKQEEYLFSSR